MRSISFRGFTADEIRSILPADGKLYEINETIDLEDENRLKITSQQWYIDPSTHATEYNDALFGPTEPLTAQATTEADTVLRNREYLVSSTFRLHAHVRLKMNFSSGWINNTHFFLYY
jgi:hypothetical protein